MVEPAEPQTSGSRTARQAQHRRPAYVLRCLAAIDNAFLCSRLAQPVLDPLKTLAAFGRAPDRVMLFAMTCVRCGAVGLMCVALICGCSDAGEDQGAPAGAGAPGDGQNGQTAGATGAAGAAGAAGASAASGGGGGTLPVAGVSGAAGAARASGGGGGASGGAGGEAGSGGGGQAGGGGLSAMCPRWTNHTEGSRIRLKFVVSEQGDRSYAGWRDSELDISCSWQGATDGTIRCLPISREDSKAFYLDEECTETVYTRAYVNACETGEYMQLTDRDSSPPVYAIYEPGTAVTPSDGLYARDTAGSCLPATEMPDEPLYRLGPEVQPGQFAEATSGELSTAGRITTYGYLAVDGARWVMGWTDNQLGGERWFMRVAQDGETRFLPSRASSFWVFSDSSCSTPLFFQSSRDDQEPPIYVIDTPPNECRNDPSAVLRLGAEFTGTPYSWGDTWGEECAPLPVSENVTLYELLPVPADTFALVEPRVDESDPGRLKPRYYTSEDGGCWFNTTWDSELGVTCSFGMTADGRVRCVPSAGSTRQRVFADAQCSEPEPLLRVPDCIDSPIPRYVSTVIAPDCTSPTRHAWVTEVWETGAVIAASSLPPLWKETIDGCEQVGPEVERYVAIEPVDPSLFMAGEPP